MRHRTARRLMSLAMDRRISREEESRLLAHVDRCPRCQQTWAAMLRAERILREAPSPEPPETLVRDILARLPERRRAVAVVGPGWGWAGALMGLATALLTLLVLAAVLVLAYGVWAQAPGQAVAAWIGSLRGGIQALVRAATALARAFWGAFGVGGVALATGLALAGAAFWLVFWRLGTRRRR
jgi:predicted anti-sigma-YlaC factor YlaD